VPKRYTVRDLLRILAADGWRLARQKGSHRQFEHPHRLGRVTVAGKPSDVPPPKTARSILLQAGLDPRDPA
jgi:predicted RNA binding protein YcfA (HicA-like mRNA interferase family)